MRLFILARHAESAANAAGVLSSDPSRPVGLTSRGREQARQLGEQLANLDIDLAIATNLARTHETAELALHGRDIPLLIEPDLDELRVGAFDGKPIQMYWTWKEQHSSTDRLPLGESLDDAERRFAAALRRLLARSEAVTLIVGHELAIRSIARAADGEDVSGRSKSEIAHAFPYLFGESAVRQAAARLDAIARPAVPDTIGARAAA
jgi:broad specificity phosphatase PhoE